MEMVAAYQLDWGRLEDLREESNAYSEEWCERAAELRDNPDRAAELRALMLRTWATDNPDDAAELAELEAAAGDCESWDDAAQRISEDPLSLRIFGEYASGAWCATSYEILLTTGGPAVRIVGELDSYGEAESARLEVQDWGEPWTEYADADSDTPLAYCAALGQLYAGGDQ
ncbi:hypothetical protein [Botrimarina sp.]|uniref:hypothetical protein n=1 Tax=Botrimarina sp. TaxID=2795802 RepID=UPI0032ED8FB8